MFDSADPMGGPASLSPSPSDVHRGAASAPANAGEAWVALIGNPNTGKTTLFNALTGGRARTGNYPGVTVDKKTGTLRPAGGDPVHLLDLPGTYSLAARSPDEMVAVDVLLGHEPDTAKPSAVVVVVDATNLERNLYLVTQIMETGLPTLVALNMVDSAAERGIEIDVDALEDRLGVPVVPTVASRGEGVRRLREAIARSFHAPSLKLPWVWPAALLDAQADLGRRLEALGIDDLAPVEVRRALLDVGGEAPRRLLARHVEGVEAALTAARAVAEAGGARVAGTEACVRYGFIGSVAAACIRRPERPPVTISDRL
ncbi:MAG: FeoB small GTPase domain-containing protein, partial [Planctomycetota bacterium]